MSNSSTMDLSSVIPGPIIQRVLTGLLVLGITRIPQEKVRDVLTRAMYTLGVTMTLGLSKWQVTSSIWNKTIEPVFVDILDHVVFAIKNGLIQGLRSDKKVVKKE